MKRKNVPLFQKELRNWYDVYHRELPWRATRDPYHIWVSEVMLQQTQVNTVIPYYQRFIRRFPHVQDLAGSELPQVLKMWEGLGYYARARNLHQAAKIVVNDFHGEIPRARSDFQSLPGIGDYIASAVQSIAFDNPFPVIDGNIKRVLARLFENGTPINRPGAAKAFFEPADYLMDTKHPRKFNQAMMELGAVICKAKDPNCPVCPVQSFCEAKKNKNTKNFPVRLRSKPLPEHHLAVGIICKDAHVLITLRKPKGLLGGLWEFPGGKMQSREKPEHACIREIKEEVNLVVEINSPLAQVKHAYTHFRIKMHVYLCRYVSGDVSLNGPIDYRWILPKEIEQYAFPKANHKFFPELFQRLGDNQK